MPLVLFALVMFLNRVSCLWLGWTGPWFYNLYFCIAGMTGALYHLQIVIGWDRVMWTFCPWVLILPNSGITRIAMCEPPELLYHINFRISIWFCFYNFYIFIDIFYLHFFVLSAVSGLPQMQFIFPVFILCVLYAYMCMSRTFLV
jgi:hypothetical protein